MNWWRKRIYRKMIEKKRELCPICGYQLRQMTTIAWSCIKCGELFKKEYDKFIPYSDNDTLADLLENRDNPSRR